MLAGGGGWRRKEFGSESSLSTEIIDFCKKKPVKIDIWQEKSKHFWEFLDFPLERQ